MDAPSLPPAPDDDAARLRRALLADVRAAGLRPGNPRLLMLAGLPGTGKSAFAREAASRFPFLTLESDRLRKTMAARPEYTADENRRLFDACHWLISEFLRQGYPLLWDATNTNERDRRPVYDIARRRRAPLAVVVVTAPPETVRRRLRDREAGLDPETWSDAGWDIYSRMARMWEPVKRRHLSVNTAGDITPALRRVLAWAAG